MECDEGLSTASGIQDVDVDAIADQVWDEYMSEHSVVGSYGEWASTIADNIVRTLGYILDNTTYTEYSGAKLLTGGRLRIYSVAGSVGTTNDVISTYQITSVWAGDELDTYKVVKQ